MLGERRADANVPGTPHTAAAAAPPPLGRQGLPHSSAEQRQSQLRGCEAGKKNAAKGRQEPDESSARAVNLISAY